MKKLIFVILLWICLIPCVVSAFQDGPWGEKKVDYVLKTTAPAVTDSNYNVSTVWCDTTNDKYYVLIDNAAGAAVWREVTYVGGSPSFVTVDLTGVTDGNIPYMQAAGAGFGDSPLSRTDADTLTFQSTTGKAAILNLYSDAAEDNSDKWRVQVADGGNVTLESYATGAWVAVATWTNAGALTMTGNVAGATYGSDGSISDAELLKIDDGATTEIPVGGGAGSAMVWTTATGTGAPVRADSPTFTTQITTPIVKATSNSLALKPTTDATTAIQLQDKDGNVILNTDTTNNYIGVVTTSPQTLLDQAQFSADAVGSYHTFSKSRNATAGSHTVVQDNDVIGGVNFAPSDGTDFGTIAAQIKAEVDDAAPAASSIGGALTFSTAAGAGADDLTERMRISSAGNVSLATGNLVISTSGKGIDFSATSDATGMASELLDDYEKGTWTPILSDGSNNATMGTCSATYTKIGDTVFCRVNIVTTALGSVSGSIRITGLPYTIVNNTDNYGGCAASIGTGLNITAGYQVTLVPVANTTYAEIWLWDATTGSTNMQHTEWSDDGRASFSFNYRAA